MEGLFRLNPEVQRFERDFTFDDFDTNMHDEWKDASADRLKEPGWGNRYEYEAQLVNSVVEQNPTIKKVLEIGSGPGVLSQEVLKLKPELEFTLIDKPFAKEYFDKHNFKGKFIVKDLANSFDTEGLEDKYDLIIMNDFLEHVQNPTIIMQTVYDLTKKDSVVFVSNPNWRMNHQFIYRGLFDFDNFLYFMYVHKLEATSLTGSILKTPFYPKLDSERLLPDENIQDWNHYMTFKHRT